MSLLLSMFLMGCICYPPSIFGLLPLILFALPFFFDGGISVVSLSQRRAIQGNTEVREEDILQEDFQQQQDAPLSALERIMPNIYANNQHLLETLTSNWKDNAVEGSQQHQIAAFLVIAAQLYFGSTAEGSSALTVGTLTYAGSSLLGYFNLATTPIVRMTRLNALTAVLATMSLG